LDDDSLQLSDGDTDATLAGWDSFAQVRLILGLEEEFGIKFTVNEVAETRKVAGLHQLIRQKTA
jgi:acyl carrier protein